MNKRRSTRAYVCAALLCYSVVSGPDLQAGGLQSGEEAEQLQIGFLELSRPLSYRHVIDRPARNETSPLTAESHFELHGDAARMVAAHKTMALLQALWPYLDDSKYDADSYVILTAVFRSNVVGTLQFTYVGPDKPGNWPLIRHQEVDVCKNDIRRLLGQPNWWYPHPVLFVRETVMGESKTSAVARANHIAAMQKALEDPKTRTTNPLGVHEVLLTLSTLHAAEATQTFVDYLLFDRRTGKDFRLATTNATQLVDITDSLPMEACLPQLKLEATPLVLARIANATSEEMSCEIGGGGLPLLTINYFWLMHIREAQATEAVEGFKRTHQEMTERQLANLDMIVDAIKTKKYRPFFMDGSDWAAPRTNTTTNK